MVLFVIPIFLYLFIQNQRVQSYFTQKGITELSEYLDTEITVKSINVSFFNRVNFHDVVFKDQENDTALYSKVLSLRVNQLHTKKRHIKFGKIRFTDAQIYFKNDSSFNLNIKFVIDKLKGKGDSISPRRKWTFLVKQVVFRNAEFSYQSPGELHDDKTAINFNDLYLQDLDIILKDFHKYSDTISFDIAQMNFVEKSGFQLESFKATTSVHRTFMVFEDASFSSPNSKFNANLLAFRFKKFSDFKKGVFGSHVKMNLDVLPSIVDFDDLTFVIPQFKGIHESIHLSGNIRGYLNDMKIRDFVVEYGKATRFKGDLNIVGLPEIRETFFYIDVEDALANRKEVMEFATPRGKSLKLPPVISRLGTVHYKGKFTGYLDDFVAYGKFSSPLGLIKTDILIKPDISNQIIFKGNLVATNFDIGKLLNADKNVGNISLNANIDGSGSSMDDINGNLKGTIEKVGYKNYEYQNIEVEGSLADNAYDGSVSIKDPNIDMDLLGRFDFSKSVPEFDFTANIPLLKPHALNLIQEDSLLTSSFLVTANFVGNNLDNLSGRIKLINAFFQREKEELALYDITLMATGIDNHKNLALNAGFIDAYISGDYELTSLPGNFYQFLNHFLPSLPKGSKPEKKYDNDFNYEVKIKDTGPITSFFMPTLKIASNTTIKGKYSPATKNLGINLRSNKLVYKENTWENLYVNGQTNDTLLSLASGSKLLSLGEKIDLENFTIYTDIYKDNIDFTLRWNNWDSAIYRGNLMASAHLKKSGISNSPSLSIGILPSKVVVGDTIWRVEPSTIFIDSSMLIVENFLAINNDQFVSIDGKVSGQHSDSLRFVLNNISLDNLNFFTAKKNILFKGYVTGEAVLSDFYDEPKFRSSIMADNLIINNEMLGEAWLETSWNNTLKSIHIDAHAKKGRVKTLKVMGDINPVNKKIELDITADRLRVNIFQPYLNKLISELNGIANGKVGIEGTLSKPLANGEIKLQKTSFIVDYLQTRYNFSHNINIENNTINLEEIVIFDNLGNRTYMSGNITNDHLKNFHFDILLDAENFMFLDTKQSDNDYFYGKAFASGRINIKGPPENLHMNIDARAERNTAFYIPLNSTNEVSELNFINIIGNDGNNDSIFIVEKPYQVDVTGLSMDLDLEVTPEAEVQIIFDPKVGDIMKGRGNGNINMEINTLGKFKMYGTYEITEGDYLFTLQNVINKRFKVKSGSSIEWTGEPTDASINIEAIYRTKASLYDLLLEEEYKRRIPVECQLLMTNKLSNPAIKFDIALPTTEEEIRSKVRQAIATEDELSKQFLSLLVINSFMPDPNRGLTGGGTNSTGGNLGATGVGVTTSELLSNQLSNWLSQISNDFDVGVNYRPGDEISSDEVEVALSTQLLNDRITINGNLDVGGNQVATTNATNTSNIVGDFNVDIKLNESGKLRVKAFNRSNDNFEYENPYTQGIGLSYQEEFNTFPELLSYYWKKLFKREKDPSN